MMMIAPNSVCHICVSAVQNLCFGVTRGAPLQVLVSGGADETVRIYDWVARKESGQLHFHEGSVTCLAIWKGQYLLTGSADMRVPAGAVLLVDG